MARGTRLDQFLVEKGHYATRARARDAIKRGCVTVNDMAAVKPSAMVPETAAISIKDDAHAYVSRAALKLVHGLDTFGINPAGLVCLDVGASTGGFTQVLLERGAGQVFAVDVGHGQLDKALSNNSNVTSLEKLNARDLTLDHLEGNPPNLIVSDVSFISLRLALPPTLALAADDARCVVLVKPQFEVGRERVGKGGLVSADDAEACARDMRAWLDTVPNWSSTGLCESPIKGGDGNREFLLAGVKHG